MSQEQAQNSPAGMSPVAEALTDEQITEIWNAEFVLTQWGQTGDSPVHRFARALLRSSARKSADEGQAVALQADAARLRWLLSLKTVNLMTQTEDLAWMCTMSAAEARSSIDAAMAAQPKEADHD